ncbi:hypothetical protein KY326_04590, partial [Candidatus Woesearchaeota archaeon]|nr:hypothetical protein [Candidatus Woesearchaeota archaeon]
CSGTATLPAAVLVTDGAYYLSVNVTDSDGDTVESSPKALFVCKSLTSSGTRFNCLESDFDNDGATEGIISNFTFFNNNTNTTINLTCDACPGQVNLNQDVDGDGIDDICDGALPTQCSDGIDNDLDGYIDYPADPGCTSTGDNDESDAAVAAAPAGEGGGGGGTGWDPRFSSARTIWSAYEEEPIVPPEVEEMPYKPKPKPKPTLPKPEIPKAFALAKLPREITVNYMLESLVPLILRIVIFLLLWTIFKKTKKYFSKL